MTLPAVWVSWLRKNQNQLHFLRFACCAKKPTRNVTGFGNKPHLPSTGTFNSGHGP